MPKKSYPKKTQKLNLFSLAYFHRRKKAASEIIQADPWGEGGGIKKEKEKKRKKKIEKAEQSSSFWCSQPGGRRGRVWQGRAEPGRDGAHPLTRTIG